MKIIQITASYKPAYIYGGPIMSVAKLCECLVEKGTRSKEQGSYHEDANEVMVFTTTANGKNEVQVEPGKVTLVDQVPVTYFKRLTKDHTHFSPALLWNLRKVLRQAQNQEQGARSTEQVAKNKEKRTNLKKQQAGYNNEESNGEILREDQNDKTFIVHIHAWWNLVSILSCWLAKFYNVPVLLSPRGMLTDYTLGNRNAGFKSFIHILIGKRLLRYSHIHATSENEKNDILKFIHPKSITVIANLVDLGLGSKEQSIKNEDQRAKTKEQEVKNQEQSTKNKEQGVKNEDQRAKTKEQGIKNEDQRVKTEDQRVKTKEQGSESKEQRTQSKEQGLKSKDQRPESKEQGVRNEDQREKNKDQRPKTNEQGVKTSESSLFKIIFLSRIEEKKGLDLLIEALASSNIDWLLTIAGSGEDGYVESLKLKAESLKLEARINWLGQVSNDEKFELLAMHDLMALTSYNENFANVVIESLSVGTPVLVSHQVGLSQYIEQNNLGWITSLEPDNITQQLANAYHDTQRRNWIRTNAPRKIKTDFSENLVETYLELYRSLI